MLEFVKTGLRRFLGVSEKGSGTYSFQQNTLWGRFEKVKEGDYNSMVDAVLGWVYACIAVLQNNVAEVPMRVYKHTEKEDILIPDHIFYKLRDNPNEYMIGWELWSLLQGFLDATGNAYIYHPLTTVKRPGALYILPTNQVGLRIVNGVFLYDYNNGKGIKTYTKEEVLHLKYPSVKNIYKGMGPLEAARMGVNLDASMAQYQLSLIANKARPDILLKTDKKINKAERTRAGKEWQKLYGGPDKAGGIAVLGKGLDAVPISLSPSDLEYLKSREWNKNEICAIFNVPPYKLGEVEKVNMANAHELEHSFQKDTITPRLKLRDAYLTRLVQKYDPRLIIKSDNVVPRDKEFDLLQEDTDIKNGVRSRNEIRIKRGVDPKPGGDDLLVPFNLVPITQVSGQPEKVVTSGFSIDTTVPIITGHGNTTNNARSWKTGQVYWQGTKQEGLKQWKENNDYKIVKRFPHAHNRKEFKETYWKVYVRKTINEERLMIAKLQPYFEAQLRQVLANLRKYSKSVKIDISFILFSLSQWNSKLVKIMHPLVQASVIGGAESLIEDFGLDIVFDISNPFVGDFFSMRENKIKHINRETFDKLTKSLTEGINKGETIKELSARVEGVYSEAKGSRSRMIARTETNTANNFGHMAAMQQAHIEKKEWITAMDDDVRYTHELNQDQGCVDFHSEFHGTNEQYPGEVNCRCVVIPCMEE